MPPKPAAGAGAGAGRPAEARIGSETERLLAKLIMERAVALQVWAPGGGGGWRGGVLAVGGPSPPHQAPPRSAHSPNAKICLV